MVGPTVAALIPCYNSSLYIRRTLSSVLSQTYPPAKIIVVDDGSTDDTPAILRDFAESITVCRHPDGFNHGQYASLNLALKQARTDLIAFLDHDDLWYPRKLAVCVDALARHSESGAVYTNGDIIDSNDRRLHAILNFAPPQATPEHLMLDCFIKTPSTVVVRRELLERAGPFNASFPACADHDMWLRLAELSAIDYIATPLIAHRQHAMQLSILAKRRMWTDGFRVLEDARRRYPYSRASVKKRLAVLHYRLAQCEWWDGRRSLALARLLLSALLDPQRALSVAARGRWSLTAQ